LSLDLISAPQAKTYPYDPAIIERLCQEFVTELSDDFSLT